MKASRFARTGVVIMLAALLFVPPAAAQGQGRDRRQERKYDPASVSTVTATVQEVSTESGRGGGSGIHLVLKTEDGSTVAHLGPTSYLSANGVAFEAGDTVTVTGSNVVIDDTPALIASEIRFGETVVSLRSDSGIPAWRGQGQRAQKGNRGNGRGPRSDDDTGARRRRGWSGTDEDDARGVRPRRGRSDRPCRGPRIADR